MAMVSGVLRRCTDERRGERVSAGSRFAVDVVAAGGVTVVMRSSCGSR